jgi:hypothetical protein
MRAIAASGEMLLVHLWHGREHRLVVANFGMAVDAPPSSVGVPDELASRDWRFVFSTEERRFGGTDDRVRFDAQMISLPPQTVVWLAATEPPLPARAWRRAVGAFAALRHRGT